MNSEWPHRAQLALNLGKASVDTFTALTSRHQVITVLVGRHAVVRPDCAASEGTVSAVACRPRTRRGQPSIVISLLGVPKPPLAGAEQ